MLLLVAFLDVDDGKAEVVAWFVVALLLAVLHLCRWLLLLVAAVANAVDVVTFCLFLDVDGGKAEAVS